MNQKNKTTSDFMEVKNTAEAGQIPDVILQVFGMPMVFSALRVLYLPQTKMLLLSDFHLGKGEHFRKNGLSVPQQASDKNLQLLQAAITRFQPENICFLGDLFHSEHNPAVSALQHFISAQAGIRFILVPGNHDILPAATYRLMGLEIQKEPYLHAGLSLRHHPAETTDPGTLQIYGHLHPGVVLRSKGRQYVKLPCFHLQQHAIAMPAVGKFTGMSNISPAKTDKIIVCSAEGAFMLA